MNVITEKTIRVFLLLTASLLVLNAVPARAADSDPWRPRYHFTASSGWINDPNGLVYNSETGEYHMFYQHNLSEKEDVAAKCWGHAVSRDLVHWTELEPAIMPDENGAVWSGSAVIDRDNSSGLFDASTPPGARMVAFFTYFGGNTDLGAEKQGLAYSTDNGRTWRKYNGNPVLIDPSITDGFRDPKVFRVPDGAGGERWAMLVAGGAARLYTSKDLINWSFAGFCIDRDGNKIRTECPDLYPITADDGTEHWVFSCAGRTYYTGTVAATHDGGLAFEADSAALTLIDLPTDMYACQTFYGMPDGRRVGIYWLIDTTMQQSETVSVLDGKNWDGAESLPMEFKLVRRQEGYRLVLSPAAEVYSLISPEPAWSTGAIPISEEGTILYPGGDCASVYVKLRFRNIDASRLLIDVPAHGGESISLAYGFTGGRLTVVRSGGTVKRDNMFMDAPANADGVITLELFIDRSAVPIFDGSGHTAQGLAFTYGARDAGIELRARLGKAELLSAEVYELTNSYSGNTQPPDEKGGNKTAESATDTRSGMSAGVTAAIIAGILLLAASSAAAILITNKKR